MDVIKRLNRLSSILNGLCTFLNGLLKQLKIFEWVMQTTEWHVKIIKWVTQTTEWLVKFIKQLNGL